MWILRMVPAENDINSAAQLMWTFQSYPCSWSRSSTPLHSFTLFLCLHLSVKTSSTQVHPYVGYCVAKTRIHFQYPWLHCTNSFHVHPWALACLSPLSICLDSNVPACGWLDSWHGIESPNNAGGLHGQAALPGQRHLSCGEGLLSEGQGDTCSLCIRLHL